MRSNLSSKWSYVELYNKQEKCGGFRILYNYVTYKKLLKIN
jgi:hypothetical protein